MDGLWWKSLLKGMIWGYHHFRKHPYETWTSEKLHNHFPIGSPVVWLTQSFCNYWYCLLFFRSHIIQTSDDGKLQKTVYMRNSQASRFRVVKFCEADRYIGISCYILVLVTYPQRDRVYPRGVRCGTVSWFGATPNNHGFHVHSISNHTKLMPATCSKLDLEKGTNMTGVCLCFGGTSF